MTQTKVAIIIVTYNAMPWANQCFEPLKTLPINAKVYVIDNGSTDGTIEHIKDHYKNFVLKESSTNLGFGKANNLGFELGLKDHCTHFLLLNQDAQITWDNVFKIAELQNNNLEYGIISPVQLYNETNVDFLHLKSLMKKSYAYFNDLVCENNLKALYEISYTNAAIWMISKACLEKVGGFDPIFPHYGEDNDYSNRVNFFNLKVGLAARVKAYHLRRQEVKPKKENVKEHYVKFLVRAKQMDKKTNFVFLRILFENIKAVFSTNSNLGSISSWQALLKMWSKLFTISKHKKININTSFSFLDFNSF